MNIIKHVWSELGCHVRAWNPLPCNCDKLWTTLQEEWYGLNSAFIQRLYNSLPKHAKALKAAKDHHTHY